MKCEPQPESFASRPRTTKNDHVQDGIPALDKITIMMGSLTIQTAGERHARNGTHGKHTARAGSARRMSPVGLTKCLLLLPLLVAMLTTSAEAAFINFTNCLSPAIINSQSPQLLQFVPIFFNARFDEAHPNHNLNITIYGNVTGQAEEGPYPPPNSTSWSNSSDPFGKIVDYTVNFTTLFASFDVLTYTAYDAPPSVFCNSVINGSCPMGPLFYANGSDPYQLHAFTIAHDMYSTYSFATIVPTIEIRSGDRSAPFLACISANITPYLGSNLAAMLRYLPAAILALVGIATVTAARFSPWSSKDFFYWTSNYGRDEDVLRLVTPGFADCLQYIQFVVLAGSLSLAYPGYYQPVVSQASWSVLMFNESFVTHGGGTQSLTDGVYSVTDGAYGLTRLSQLVGMTSDTDVWAGMAIWLCVIIGAVVVLCQVAFATNWFARRVSDRAQEDFRSKNLPFTGGMVVRVVYTYFLLPIVSLSLFQLVIALRSPPAVLAMTVVGLLAVLAFAAWIFHLIFTTKPRVHLFDHLPLLMCYGPLYNTYSDEAAPFAFIPILVTFMRGIAIGAIQPSGIAQLVMLAICEVILILTLNAFRPFQSLTSMNAYHTFFSVVRLITVLLSIAFVPALAVSEASKGWIGYAVLLLHAIVLVFGFFLNALQTLIEVFARLAGAGGRDARGGLTKVFGDRQLSKRPRPNNLRNSLTSDQAMLAQDSDVKSDRMDVRSRSISGSSAMMLNHPGSALDNRSSGAFDQNSQVDVGSTVSGPSPDPSTPGGGSQSPHMFVGSSAPAQYHKSATLTSRAMEPSVPFYRPPRPRRPTLEPLTGQETGPDLETNPEGQPAQSPPQTGARDSVSTFSPNRSSLNAAYFRHFRDDSEGSAGEHRPRRVTDYSKREADFYYGIRGPALSSMPSRRLKTGPADPMSPVASATGWFRSLFGGKQKEKSKGFEVVRSTPLHLLQLEEDEEMGQMGQEPYADSPQRKSSLPQDGDAQAGASQGSPRKGKEAREFDMHQISDAPPVLDPIETGGFDFPSRMNSQSSTKPSASHIRPIIPRRSSKRNSLGAVMTEGHFPVLGPGPSFKSNAPRWPSFRHPQHPSPSEEADARVPFGGAGNSGASNLYPAGEEALSPPYEEEEARSGSNAPFAEQERPLSTGRVAHHLASDNIHQGAYDHLETRAELVEDPHDNC